MFTESDLYQELGLEEPSGEGAQEQEVTEPAQPDGQQNETGESTEEPEAEGAEVQEVTDPAKDPETKKTPMSDEERHANAARRRQKEREALFEEAKSAAKKEFDAKIKEIFAGKTNPYTEKPIESMEDVLAMQEQERQAQISKDLKAGKLTQDAINEAVKNNPLLKQAEQLINDAEAARKAAQEQQEKADAEAFGKKVEEEFKTIAEINPKYKTLNDIMQSNDPEKEEFVALVSNHGLSYLQAFKLAYADKIAEQKAAAASAGATIKQAGKEHLKATASRGQGSMEVPDDVKEYFRMFTPNATDDEIRASYAKFIKQTKKQGG